MLRAQLLELAAQWRQQADDLERTAKVYTRQCVEAKAVQNILLARQQRANADAITRLADSTPVLD